MGPKGDAGDGGKITSFFKPRPKVDLSSDEQPEKPIKVSSKRKLLDDPSVTEVKLKVQKLGRELEELVSGMGQSWLSALEQEVAKPYFASLSRFLEAERSAGLVHPSREQVWAWTARTDISDTRVVILGQDPYPTPGNAHGLCFSVQMGVPHPASLKNIFKELEQDIPGFRRPQHGFLGGWADQGVLLLNSVLTVRSGAANSHKGRGWEQFTDAVIRWISDNCRDVVFLLWGGYAQKKAAKVDAQRHSVLKATHPSPLGANKGGWFGCGHFSKCNELLLAAGREPVDWGSLPGGSECV